MSLNFYFILFILIIHKYRILSGSKYRIYFFNPFHYRIQSKTVNYGIKFN